MKFIFPFLAILLFLIACGHSTAIFNSENNGQPSTVSPASGGTQNDGTNLSLSKSLTVTHLAFEQDTPFLLHVSYQQQLSLTVSFSDGTTANHVYRGTDALPNSVLWFSENNHVATISPAGQLVAVAEGRTTIHASMLNQSALLDLMVAPEIISAARLVFHQPEAAIAGYNTFYLTLDGLFSDGSDFSNKSPDTLRSSLGCDLHFSSSDENIFLVTQAGVLIPVANGSARVVLQCGLNADSIAVAVSGITPSPTSPPSEVLQSITLLPDTSNWLVGDTKTLDCDLQFDSGLVHAASDHFVTPLGSQGVLSWGSSNTALASVDHGIVSLGSYGSVTLTASFQGKSASLQKFIYIKPETPGSAAEYFIGSNDVATITYGVNAGYGANLFPQIIYGPPRAGGTNVVSLGGGGKILIEFQNYLPVDGPGKDFTIFENPVYSSQYGLFAERAQVSVSEDGVNFYKYPCNAFDPAQIYAECAGVHPVNYAANPLDPSVSGGDTYDLQESGLNRIRYILIQDMNTCVPGDPTYAASNADGTPLCTTAGEQGFDLDAIAIVNGVNGQ